MTNQKTELMITTQDMERFSKDSMIEAFTTQRTLKRKELATAEGQKFDDLVKEVRDFDGKIADRYEQLKREEIKNDKKSLEAANKRAEKRAVNQSTSTKQAVTESTDSNKWSFESLVQIPVSGETYDIQKMTVRDPKGEKISLHLSRIMKSGQHSKGLTLPFNATEAADILTAASAAARALKL